MKRERNFTSAMRGKTAPDKQRAGLKRIGKELKQEAKEGAKMADKVTFPPSQKKPRK